MLTYIYICIKLPIVHFNFASYQEEILNEVKKQCDKKTRRQNMLMEEFITLLYTNKQHRDLNENGIHKTNILQLSIKY